MKTCISVSLIMHICLALVLSSYAVLKPDIKVVHLLDVTDISLPSSLQRSSKTQFHRKATTAVAGATNTGSQAVRQTVKAVTAEALKPQQNLPKPFPEPAKTEQTKSSGAVKPGTPQASVNKGLPGAGHSAPQKMQPAARPAGDVQFGSAAGPAFAQRVQPVYPHIARRFGREGTVLLRLSISEKGALSDIEILKDPGHGFAASAIEALRKSSFIPATNNGVPIKVKAVLPIRFALQNN